jgi:hypothetical protein
MPNKVIECLVCRSLARSRWNGKALVYSCTGCGAEFRHRDIKDARQSIVRPEVVFRKTPTPTPTDDVFDDLTVEDIRAWQAT